MKLRSLLLDHPDRQTKICILRRFVLPFTHRVKGRQQSEAA